MDQRISFVTLAVADVERSRAFYVDGLGWTPELLVPGEVLMIQTGEHLVLSLWAEAAGTRAAPSSTQSSAASAATAPRRPGPWAARDMPPP